MKQHETIEVGVVWVEMSRLVKRMVVFDVSADLHLMTYSVFDNGAERIGRCAFGEGEFGVSVRHAFGADEDKVEGDAREQM